MSLPQTECAVPPGEQARVSVCPSLPFSDVAFASQVVGVPTPAEEGGGGGDDGPLFVLLAVVAVCPPPPPLLFSVLSFAQAALPNRNPVSKSATQQSIVRRSNRSFITRVDRHNGVTEIIPFVF
jgi:hypothetical protein